jgi:hypothetical protein
MSVVSLLVAARLVQGVDLPHHLRIEAGSFAAIDGGIPLHRLWHNISLCGGIELSPAPLFPNGNNMPTSRPSIKNIPVREISIRKRILSMLRFPYGNPRGRYENDG